MNIIQKLIEDRTSGELALVAIVTGIIIFFIGIKFGEAIAITWKIFN